MARWGALPSGPRSRRRSESDTELPRLSASGRWPVPGSGSSGIGGVGLSWREGSGVLLPAATTNRKGMLERLAAAAHENGQGPLRSPARHAAAPPPVRCRRGKGPIRCSDSTDEQGVSRQPPGTGLMWRARGVSTDTTGLVRSRPLPVGPTACPPVLALSAHGRLSLADMTNPADNEDCEPCRN